MAGTIIPLISLRSFDFAGLASSESMTVVLIKEIDVSGWTEGVLNVRIHGGTIDSTATANISVVLAATSPSSDEPTKDFIDSTAVASVAIDDGNIGNAPTLVRASLATGFGGMLCLKVIGTQDPTRLANLNADISAELVLKA